MYKALWLLYIYALSAVVSANRSDVFTAHIHSRSSGKGPTLIQALQNKTVTHVVIVPERLDVAVELEGLEHKFRLDRCAGFC